MCGSRPLPQEGINKMKLLLVGFFILMAANEAHATDLATSKRLAITCIACHGEQGVSVSPLFPNLAGQKKDYLVKELKQFKSGERKDPIMSPLAQTVADEDVEALAEYFSSLK